MTWFLAIGALASALVGGVFFAFSSFVMPALGRLPPAQSIRAMQRINLDVFHWSFLGLFFGTPALCLALAAHALWQRDASTAYTLAGSASYLLGCLLVTGTANVPRNETLAKIDPDTPDAADHWQRFARGWTPWNHVRTLACITAATAFLAARTA